MLVIRRRVGETLLIGEDVEVHVLEMGGSQVKLGIRAPKSIGVVRKEIKTVVEQNVAAACPIAAPGLEKFLKNLKPEPSAPISPV